MAILPDLDPNEIGVIAFWNAHDHRVAGSTAVIDPTDVLGVLKSYTLYDNGVDGVIDYSPRAGINVRVKNDGWIIAWIDRTNTYQQNVLYTDFTSKGYYDLISDWKACATSFSTDTNTLIEVISYLYSQLGSAEDFSFSKSDVGTYCYEFERANSFTIALSGYCACNVNVDITRYIKFIITSGTSIFHTSITGMSRAPTDVSFTTYVLDETNTILAQAGAGQIRYGCKELSYSYDSELTLTARAAANTSQCIGAIAGLIVLWG